MKTFKIEELNHLLGGDLIGDTNVVITAPDHLDTSGESSISFIGSKKYLKKWEHAQAKAAIIQKNLVGDTKPGEGRCFIVVDNADLAMAKVLEFFSEDPVQFDDETCSSATVHQSAIIGENSKVGAHSYIGSGVQIGTHCVIYPNTTILDDAIIGDHTVIKSGTVISERCMIGDHCTLHSNVNIGTDGFGYRASEDGRSIVKIPHIGNVEIGDHVEIGSGTCIDRGKFSSTSIGDGTKIDNIVQIAHNCQIGKQCLIAGCCGIGGSVTLGDGVTVAGQVSIKDQVQIGHGAMIGAKSLVIKNVPDGATVLGIPADDSKKTLKKWGILNRLVKKPTS